MTTTQLTLIDGRRALELLEEAVAERGRAFIYNNDFPDDCAYMAYRRESFVDDELVPGATTEPACIIGVALSNLGIDGESLEVLTPTLPLLAGFVQAPGAVNPREYRRDPVDPKLYSHQVLRRCVPEEQPVGVGFLGYELDENATRIWWAAQVTQDSGRTWGAALDLATAVAANLGVIGLRFCIDADCPACGYPERWIDHELQAFGCNNCTYRSQEREK